MDAEQALDRILNDPALADQKRRLVARLDESRRQFDEGEYVEFDEEGLRQLFERLKERACKRHCEH